MSTTLKDKSRGLWWAALWVYKPVQVEDGSPVPVGHVLHLLHLVDDQAPPPHLGKGVVAPEEPLVGCDADIEAVGLCPLLWAENKVSTVLLTLYFTEQKHLRSCLKIFNTEIIGSHLEYFSHFS